MDRATDTRTNPALSTSAPMTTNAIRSIRPASAPARTSSMILPSTHGAATAEAVAQPYRSTTASRVRPCSRTALRNRAQTTGAGATGSPDVS